MQSKGGFLLFLSALQTENVSLLSLYDCKIKISCISPYPLQLHFGSLGLWLGRSLLNCISAQEGMCCCCYTKSACRSPSALLLVNLTAVSWSKGPPRTGAGSAGSWAGFGCGPRRALLPRCVARPPVILPKSSSGSWGGEALLSITLVTLRPVGLGGARSALQLKGKLKSSAGKGSKVRPFAPAPAYPQLLAVPGFSQVWGAGCRDACSGV